MKLASIAFAFALIAALMLIAAGPGTRLDLWEFRTGFLLMRWALFVGLGAAAFAVILLLIPKTRRGRSAILVATCITGLVTAWVPWNGYRTVRSLPFIHDITTDTEDPPQFVDVIPLRSDAPNPVEYAGADVALQQREAYPDIRPLELAQPPQQTFDRARAVATELGWEIVAADPVQGRIEATATTLWFGFKDDVVIRVTPSSGGSRLDIRSKSRVGKSDVGANAARIRRFLGAMQDER